MSDGSGRPLTWDVLGGRSVGGGRTTAVIRCADAGGGATNRTPGPLTGRLRAQRIGDVIALAGSTFESCTVVTASERLDDLAALCDRLARAATVRLPDGDG